MWVNQDSDDLAVCGGSRPGHLVINLNHQVLVAIVGIFLALHKGRNFPHGARVSHGSSQSIKVHPRSLGELHRLDVSRNRRPMRKEEYVRKCYKKPMCAVDQTNSSTHVHGGSAEWLTELTHSCKRAEHMSTVTVGLAKRRRDCISKGRHLATLIFPPFFRCPICQS